MLSRLPSTRCVFVQAELDTKAAHTRHLSRDLSLLQKELENLEKESQDKLAALECRHTSELQSRQASHSAAMTALTAHTEAKLEEQTKLHEQQLKQQHSSESEVGCLSEEVKMLRAELALEKRMKGTLVSLSDCLPAGQQANEAHCWEIYSNRSCWCMFMCCMLNKQPFCAVAWCS